MIIYVLSALKNYRSCVDTLNCLRELFLQYSQSSRESKKSELYKQISEQEKKINQFKREWNKNKHYLSPHSINGLQHELEVKENVQLLMFCVFDELKRILDAEEDRLEERVTKLKTKTITLCNWLYKNEISPELWYELNQKWEMVRVAYKAKFSHSELPLLPRLNTNQSLRHINQSSRESPVNLQLAELCCNELIELHKELANIQRELLHRNDERLVQTQKDLLAKIKVLENDLYKSYDKLLSLSKLRELKKYQRLAGTMNVLWMLHKLVESLSKLGNQANLENGQLITTIENREEQVIVGYVNLLVKYRGLPYNLYQELSSKWNDVILKHSTLHPGVLSWSFPSLPELSRLIGIPSVWIDFEQRVAKLGIEFTPESIREIQTSLMSFDEKLELRKQSYDNDCDVDIVYCDISREILLTIVTTQIAGLKNKSIMPLQKNIMELICITYGLSEKKFELVDVYKSYDQLLKFLLNYTISSGYDIDIVTKLLQLCKKCPKVVEEAFMEAMRPITDNYLERRPDDKELESELQCKEETAKSILDQSGRGYYDILDCKLIPRSQVSQHRDKEIRLALLCLLKLLVENKDRMTTNEDITDFIARQFKEFFEESSVNYVSRNFSSFLEKRKNFASVIQQRVVAKINELTHDQEALEKFAQNDTEKLLNDIHNFLLLECGQGWTNELEYLLIVISYLLENDNSKNVFKQVNVIICCKFLQTLFNAQQALRDNDIDFCAKKFILLRITGEFLCVLSDKILDNVLKNLKDQNKNHFPKWLYNVTLVQDDIKLASKMAKHVSINAENLQQDQQVFKNTHGSDLEKIGEELLIILAQLLDKLNKINKISTTICNCIQQQTAYKDYVLYEKIGLIKQELSELANKIPSCLFYLCYLKKTGSRTFSTQLDHVNGIRKEVEKHKKTIDDIFIDIQSRIRDILKLLPDDTCDIHGISIIKDIIESLAEEEKLLKPRSRHLLLSLACDLFVVANRAANQQLSKHIEEQGIEFTLLYVPERRKSKDAPINVIDYDQLYLDIFTMIIAQSDSTREGEVKNGEFYSAQVMFSKEEYEKLMNTVRTVFRNKTNRDFPNEYTCLDALENAIRRAGSGTVRKIYIRGGWHGDEPKIENIIRLIIQESDYNTLDKVLNALKEKVNQLVIEEMFRFACSILLNDLDNFEKKLKCAELLFGEVENHYVSRTKNFIEDLFEIMCRELSDTLEKAIDSSEIENIKILIYVSFANFIIQNKEFQTNYSYCIAKLTVQFRLDIKAFFEIVKTDSGCILRLKNASYLKKIFTKCKDLSGTLEKSPPISSKQLTFDINSAIDNVFHKFEREKVAKIKSILSVYYQCLSNHKEEENMVHYFYYINKRLLLTNEEFKTGINSLNIDRIQIENELEQGIEDKDIESEKRGSLAILNDKIKLLEKCNSNVTTKTDLFSEAISDIDQIISDYKKSSIRDFVFTRSEFLLLLENIELWIEKNKSLLSRHDLENIENKIRNFISTINTTFPLTERDFQGGVKALENEIANTNEQNQKLLKNRLRILFKEKARNEVNDIRENVKKLLNNYSNLKTFLEQMLGELKKQQKVNILNGEKCYLSGDWQIISGLFGNKEELYKQFFSTLSKNQPHQFLFTGNCVSTERKDSLEIILIILSIMQKYPTYMLLGSEEEKFLADPNNTNFMGDITGRPVFTNIDDVVIQMPRASNAVNRGDQVSQNYILNLLKEIFTVLPKKAVSNGNVYPCTSIFSDERESAVLFTHIDVFKSASDDDEMRNMINGLLANLILKHVNKEVWYKIFFDYMRIKYGKDDVKQDNITKELNSIAEELCKIGFTKEMLESYCKVILSDFTQPDIEGDPLLNRCYRLVSLWEQGEEREELDTEMIEAMRNLFRVYKENIELETLTWKLWNIILNARLKERHWITEEELHINERITLRQNLANIKQQYRQQFSQSSDQKEKSLKTILVQAYILVKKLGNLDDNDVSGVMSQLTDYFSVPSFSNGILENVGLLMNMIGQLVLGVSENFSLETRQVILKKLFFLIQLKRYLNLDELLKDVVAIIEGVNSLEEQQLLHKFMLLNFKKQVLQFNNECSVLDERNKQLFNDIQKALNKIRKVNQTLAEKLFAVVKAIILSPKILFRTKNIVCSALLKINLKKNGDDLNQSILKVVQSAFNMQVPDDEQTLIFESPENTEYQKLKHVIQCACAEVDLSEFIARYSEDDKSKYDDDKYLLTFITKFNDLLCKNPNLDKLKNIPNAFITLLQKTKNFLTNLQNGLYIFDDKFHQTKSRIEKVMQYETYTNSVQYWLQRLDNFETETWLLLQVGNNGGSNDSPLEVPQTSQSMTLIHDHSPPPFQVNLSSSQANSVTQVDMYKETSDESSSDQEGIRDFKRWYDSEEIGKICFYNKPRGNNAPFAFIFFPCNEGDGTSGYHAIKFSVQLKELNTIKNYLNVPALFISFAPGVSNSHFILGIIHDQNLLIINPVGAYGVDNKSNSFLNALVAEKLVDTCGGIRNIYVSTVQIQTDGSKGVFSCGPICAELMNQLLMLPRAKFDEYFQKYIETVSVTDYSKRIGQGIIGINNIYALLPQSLLDLRAMSGKNYEQKILEIRRCHAEILGKILENETLYYTNDPEYNAEEMLRRIQTQKRIMDDADISDNEEYTGSDEEIETNVPQP